MSQRRARLALLLISAAIGLALAEIAVRLALPRPGFEPIPARPSIVPDPILGYAYAPNFPGVTNAFGLRDAPIAPGDTVHVLAVGDSFTVGGGLKREDAWPAQLQARINDAGTVPFRVRVVNGGVTAYSVRQIRQLTESLAPRLRPQVVVLGLFTSRYWRIDDPYVFFHGVAVRRSDAGRLKVVSGGYIQTVFSTRWLQSLDYFLADHFYLADHLLRQGHRLFGKTRGGDVVSAPAAQDVESRLTSLLRELQNLQNVVAASNAALVVLLINEQQPDGEFAPVEKDYNRVVTSFCQSIGVTVVDPLPALEKLAGGKPIFRQGSDHHWNAAAQRIAADEVWRVLAKEGLLARLRER